MQACNATASTHSVIIKHNLKCETAHAWYVHLNSSMKLERGALVIRDIAVNTSTFIKKISSNLPSTLSELFCTHLCWKRFHVCHHVYPPGLDWKQTAPHTPSHPCLRSEPFGGCSSGHFLDAMPHQTPGLMPFFLMPASDDFSPVPARPGADGSVQHGVTPADTVACQTGGRRPGRAEHSHTVPPYGE